MSYRLLIDLEAVTLLQTLPKSTRTRLMEQFVRLRLSPEQCSNHHEKDQDGRRVEISVCAGYSVHYWIDAADRHIKILALKPAKK